MKLKDYFLITFFTIISPLINGYYFNVLDHHHYLPYLNKLLNPALYLNDYYFSQPHNLYSPFNYFIVFIKKLFNLNLPWTYFILYFISLWLLYFAVYYLTYTIYKKSEISFLAVFLFLLPKWAAQIGYMTHHFYFVSRDLSLAISLIALTLIILKKTWLSLIFILSATLVNLSIPIPVIIFWLLPWFKKLKNKFSSLLVFNLSWMNTLRKRGTYSFPHLWKWTGWGNLVLFLSLLATSWFVLKDKIFNKHTKIIKQFLFICSGLFLFHFIISAIIPTPVLIQLQLLRSLNYIFILALISFSVLNYKFLVSQSKLFYISSLIAVTAVFLWGDHLTIWHFLGIWSLSLLIFLKKPQFKKQVNQKLFFPLIIIILFSLLFYKLFIIKPKINLPYYFYYPNALIKIDDFDDWLDIQIWAKNNTTENKVFLTPPQQAGFRSFSQRSIVGDRKDGGGIFYSPQYAQLWQQRMQDIKNFNQITEVQANQLKVKYQYDYLVVFSTHQPLDFIQAYRNKNFIIYKP